MLLVRIPRHLHRSHGISLTAYRAQRVYQLSAHARHATKIATPPKAQPTELSEDEKRTLRRRDHGNRSLPLPPLLDALATQRKEKHKLPKALAQDCEKTPFQKELELNVYAQALAAPVRLCSFTNARLPSHFLLPTVSQIRPQSTCDGVDIDHKLLKATLLPADLVVANNAVPMSPSRSYVLRQKHILEHLSSKRRWAMIVSERMKKWLALKKQKQLHGVDVQKEWEWDQKTLGELLAKLRRDVVEEVAKVTEHGLLVPGQQLKQPLFETSKAACVLFVTPGEREESKHVEDLMLGDVPTFDLASMLGAAEMLSLADRDGIFADASLLLVEKSIDTIPLQLALVRLEGYLVDGTS